MIDSARNSLLAVAPWMVQTISLSKQSIENLTDLVEIKIGWLQVIDRDGDVRFEQWTGERFATGPAIANSSPDKPIPPNPQGPRFRSFRASPGKFVKSGDQAHLRRALGEYARTATEGVAVGPRRFGSMSRAGSALFAVLNDPREGGTGEAAWLVRRQLT